MEENILIYNEEKTEILNLEDLDLEKGYLRDDTLIVEYPYKEYKKPVGHYEVIREYENGGKDMEFVIDEEGQDETEAWTEYKHIKVYIRISDEELAQRALEDRLADLKGQLASTDYEAIKFAEGWLTEEEYAPIRAQREALREQIREIIDK